MSGPRFDDLDGEVEEAPGVLQSFARGAKQGVTLGFGDEMSGVAGALGQGLGNNLRRLREGNLIPDSLEDVGRNFDGMLGAYRSARDDVRAEDDAAQQENPFAFGAGEFGGAVAPALVTGGAAAGWRGAAKVGAMEGAAAGLGGSRAELTDGDVYEYVRAAGDTGKGAALGAALGGVADRAGAGLRWLGGKARGALDGARGGMFREEAQRGMDELARVDGVEIGRREAARAQEAKATERMGREQGRAMEMNKGFDRRAQREAEREARRAEPRSPRGRAPELPVEPDTRALEGYEGKAFERQQNRSDKAMARRKAIDAGENNTSWRQDAQQYIDRMPEALDNPGGARRIYLERFLRERYGPDVAERVLRERFDEGGRLRPRAAAASAGDELPEMVDGARLKDDFDPSRVREQAMRDYPGAASGPPLGDATRARVNRDAERVVRGAWEERTMVPEPADVVRQGRAAEAMRQGGGGPSAFSDEWANAPTRVDPRMQPDPFHDAPTRVALIETTPTEASSPKLRDLRIRMEEAYDVGDEDLYERLKDELGDIRGRRTFEFRDKRSGRIFELEADADASDGGIWVNGVGPKDLPEGMTYEHAWGEEANKVGAMALRQVLPDLAKAFPGAEQIGGLRVTGIRKGKDGGGKARNTWAPLPNVTQPMDMGDVIRQGRVEIGGGGPSAFGDAFAEAPTRVDREAFPTDSQVWLDAVRRQVDIEGRPPEPFWTEGPPLSPMENAQMLESMRNMPEDTIPAYGGPIGRDGGQVPMEADLVRGEPGPAMRSPALAPMPAAKPGAGPRYGERRAPASAPPLDEEMALRRAAGAQARVGGGAPTRNARAPAAPAPAPAPLERTAPRARPAPNEPSGPEAFVGEEPREFFSDLTMPNSAGPLRSPAMERAMAREAQGGRDILNAFGRGAAGEGAAAFGLGGMLLDGVSGGIKGVLLRGGMSAVREVLQNPAAKARALSALRLSYLERASPAAFSRVGRALATAWTTDPEEARVIEHVAMQTDPEFRSAMRAADEEVSQVSDEELVEALVAGGLL